MRVKSMAILTLLALNSLSLAAEKALPAPSQKAIDAAVKAPLTRHGAKAKGGAHTYMGLNGGAPILMTAAAKAGNTSADARLLEQMRFSLQGQNAITANGGYPAQHERYITGMFAVCKTIPRLWDKLTTEEKHKADLMMKAAFIASAFTTSDSNPFIAAKETQRDLVGGTNLSRGWNPNFREGMIGGLFPAIAYFGGPEKATKVLDEYKHEAFVAQLKEAGLTNIHDTFNARAAGKTDAPTAEQIEQAVHGYRLHKMDLSDPMKIYTYLVEDTFGKEVTAGLNGGKGIVLDDGTVAGVIKEGADSLPNKGKIGMLKEFSSNDAKGRRSSIGYCWDGFRCNLTNQFILIATGYWTPGPEADAAAERINVGATDLFYKIDKGYWNYSKGRREKDFSLDDNKHGVTYLRPLWEEVIKPAQSKL